MKVKKVGEAYQVRVEELLPCKEFRCYHEHIACATVLWCPDSCFDTNDYYAGACIPDCLDCVKRLMGECKETKKRKGIILNVEEKKVVEGC